MVSGESPNAVVGGVGGNECKLDAGLRKEEEEGRVRELWHLGSFHGRQQSVEGNRSESSGIVGHRVGQN
jgi:hypothetical protein